MSPRDPDPGSASGAAAAAAAWVVRHERGLTAEEQDAFSAWMAADAANRAAFAEHRWTWEELDRLNGLQTSSLAVAPEGEPASSERRRARRWWPAASIAAAAVAAMAIATHLNLSRTDPTSSTNSVPALPLCREETLADGSRIDLNRGATISVAFTPTERRVRLERGEAHFAVAKDSQRPFVVEVDGIAVRAVGTAFSVRRGAEAVAVLVTEGTVALSSPAVPRDADPPLITAGQKAVVSLSSRTTATVIESVDAAEIEERMAWRPRMLEFDEAPLAEIAAEFNRRNPVQIEIPETALRGRRLTATLRSDNMEGFVRLLESDFAISASRPHAETIVLRSRR